MMMEEGMDRLGLLFYIKNVDYHEFLAKNEEAT